MEKLILIHYLNFDNSSPQYIHESLELYHKYLESKNDDMISHYIIPVSGQETKIECINPIMIDDELAKDILVKLDKIENDLNIKYTGLFKNKIRMKKLENILKK